MTTSYQARLADVSIVITRIHADAMRMGVCPLRNTSNRRRVFQRWLGRVLAWGYQKNVHARRTRDQGPARTELRRLQLDRMMRTEPLLVWHPDEYDSNVRNGVPAEWMRRGDDSTPRRYTTPQSAQDAAPSPTVVRDHDET